MDDPRGGATTEQSWVRVPANQPPSATARFVVGKRDRPTDGVHDYVGRLVGALEEHGIAAHLCEWRGPGWVPNAPWLGSPCPVALQFTHLAWSSRGFSLRVLAVARRIRRAGFGLVTVLHDPNVFPGTGAIASARRSAQVFAMRGLLRLSSTVVTTVEPALIRWATQLRSVERSKLVHVPVGSNVRVRTRVRRGDQPFTVAVFGVTEGNVREARAIATVAREVAGPTLRLDVFGRGATSASDVIRRDTQGASLELRVGGVLPEVEVASRLADADALLFLRGVSARRGSLIAGISSGLPVVGFSGPETGSLMERCGIILVDPGDVHGAASALRRLRGDPGLAMELSETNLEMTKRVFDWSRIAEAFAGVLW